MIKYVLLISPTKTNVIVKYLLKVSNLNFSV